MKVFRLNKYTYTIDFPVLFLFLGVSLDIISTFLFVALNAGIESHPILKELISISIWFIPLYLFITNAFFIPFLPIVLRKTLSYTIGTSSVLFAMNNFSLILFRKAFLIDTVGYTSTIIIFVLFGLTLFFYYMKKKRMNKKEITSTLSTLLFYLIFLGLIQTVFMLII